MGEMWMQNLLPLYYGFISLLGFSLCGYDKMAAVRNRRRIPDRRLLALCALGACLGFGAGMLLFRHKIRKKRFTLSMPLFILLHLILVWILLKY